MNDSLRNALALPVMAIGGCIGAAAFFYIRVVLIGVESSTVDSGVVPIEGGCVMMSSIAISGRLFHALLGADDEAQSIKAFMGWRIILLHILTGAMILLDVLT